MEVDIKCTPITRSAYRAQLLLNQMPEEPKKKIDWGEVIALFFEFVIGMSLYALPFLLLLVGWLMDKLSL